MARPSRSAARPGPSRRPGVGGRPVRRLRPDPLPAYLPVEKPSACPARACRPTCRPASPSRRGRQHQGRRSLGLDGVEIQHADADGAGDQSPRSGETTRRPSPGEVDIASVTLDKPEVTVSRDREGRISLLSLVPGCTAAQPRRRRLRTGAPTGKSEAKARASPVRLMSFFDGGRIDLTDQLAAGPSTRPFRISTSAAQALPATAPAELDVASATDAGEKLVHQVGSLGLRPQGRRAARVSPVLALPPTSSTSPRR